MGTVPTAQSITNWRNTHTHMDCTQTLITSTQLQPCGAKHQVSYYFSVRAGTVYWHWMWHSVRLVGSRSVESFCGQVSCQSTCTDTEGDTQSSSLVLLSHAILWTSQPSKYVYWHWMWHCPSCWVSLSQDILRTCQLTSQQSQYVYWHWMWHCPSCWSCWVMQFCGQVSCHSMCTDTECDTVPLVVLAESCNSVDKSAVKVCVLTLNVTLSPLVGLSQSSHYVYSSWIWHQSRFWQVVCRYKISTLVHLQLNLIWNLKSFIL